MKNILPNIGLVICLVVGLVSVVSVPSWAGGPKTAYEQGLVEAEDDRWQSAISFFSKAIAQNPKDDDAFQQRARCYTKIKNFPAAIEDCNAALKINPHKARSFGYRGFAYLCLGQYAKGMEDCKSAITLDRPDELDVLVPGSYLNLQKALNVTGHPELAGQYEMRARNLDLIVKAKEARENKRMGLAFSLVNKAIANDPRESSAYFVRGILHSNSTEYEKALADFSTAVKLEPRWVSAYYFRADVLSQLGHYRLAIQDYDRIIALNPRVVAFRLVTESGRLRDYFSGKDDEIISIEDMYFLRGKAKVALGNKKAALQDLEIASKLDPTDTQALSMKAELQSEAGQSKKAIDSLSASVKIDKDNWQMLASRARVYEAQKDYRKALDDYTHIIAAQPKEPGAYFFRAQLEEKIGDLKAAIKDYSEMVALRPDDDDAYKCRGDCYLLLSDFQKAIDDYSVLIKHDPLGSSSVYAARATAYEKSGQKALAAKDRARAMEKVLRAPEH